MLFSAVRWASKLFSIIFVFVSISQSAFVSIVTCHWHGKKEKPSKINWEKKRTNSCDGPYTNRIGNKKYIIKLNEYWCPLKKCPCADCNNSMKRVLSHRMLLRLSPFRFMFIGLLIFHPYQIPFTLSLLCWSIEFLRFVNSKNQFSLVISRIAFEMKTVCRKRALWAFVWFLDMKRCADIYRVLLKRNLLMLLVNLDLFCDHTYACVCVCVCADENPFAYKQRAQEHHIDHYVDSNSAIINDNEEINNNSNNNHDAGTSKWLRREMRKSEREKQREIEIKEKERTAYTMKNK